MSILGHAICTRLKNYYVIWLEKGITKVFYVEQWQDIVKWQLIWIYFFHKNGNICPVVWTTYICFNNLFLNNVTSG